MANALQWVVGSILVGSGGICFGYGSGMMWRAWKAITPPICKITTLDKSDFVPVGARLDGFVYFMTSDGRCYRFKAEDGKLPDS